MAKKNARRTKGLAGMGKKLEQPHACVNQIPGEESGLRLLNGMKLEAVICTRGGLSSAHTLSGSTAVVNSIQIIFSSFPSINSSRPMTQDASPASFGTVGAVVIGGANIDHKSQTLTAPVFGTSNPGHSRTSSGGVGRNVAENLARMGVRTRLITSIGVDADGDRLARETAGAGVDLRLSLRTARPTGRYTAVLDDRGDMVIAVSAMDAIEDITIELVDRCAAEIASAGILVLDCNIPEAALVRAGAIARDSGTPIVADPVSTPKAGRIRALLAARIPVHTMTPNRDELGAIAAALGGAPAAAPSTDDDSGPEAAAALLHDAGVANVWVRLGSEGSYFSAAEGSRKRARFIAANPSTLVDVTGAGDAMLAGYVAALLAGMDPFLAARYGSAAAAITIESTLTVNPSISFAELAARAESP